MIISPQLASIMLYKFQGYISQLMIVTYKNIIP